MIKTEAEDSMLESLMLITEELRDEVRVCMKNYDTYQLKDEPLLAAIEQAKYRRLFAYFEKSNAALGKALDILEEKESAPNISPLKDSNLKKQVN